MSTTNLQGRTFFVTGANSGLGRATVEALAARGGSVVLASRSEERTRPVLAAIQSQHRDADLQFVSIDLADLASVQRAAEAFLSSGRALDVLINNAGLAGARGLTKDGFEITVGTNHLGPFLLTELL
ncbi:MAG: SDR family NAD(P)-dependent oxidoreductase, partial [Chloroflexota bacterium]|nr:SDR family NAD(P)-dependent oxidoreductase [Chloroflexota bacterium]